MALKFIELDDTHGYERRFLAVNAKNTITHHVCSGLPEDNTLIVSDTFVDLVIHYNISRVVAKTQLCRSNASV